jgi:hypothetical protein
MADKIFVAVLITVILILGVILWKQYQKQCELKTRQVDPRVKPVHDIMINTLLKYKQFGCGFANPEMVLMGLQEMAGELCSAHVKNDVNATTANIRALIMSDYGGAGDMGDDTNMSGVSRMSELKNSSSDLDNADGVQDMNADTSVEFVVEEVEPENSGYMSVMSFLPGGVQKDARDISDELIKLYAHIAENICVDGEPNMDKLTIISQQIYNNLCSKDGVDFDAGMRNGVLLTTLDATVLPLLGPHANGSGMNMQSTSAAKA